jgi:hypothetical protein
VKASGRAALVVGTMAACGAGVLLALAGYGLTACGTDSSGNTTDAGGTDAADALAPRDSGPDAVDIFVRGDAGCPPQAPPANLECNEPGLWCEYGDGGAHSLCTTKVHCDVLAKSGGLIAWHVMPADKNCGLQLADCPQAFGEAPDAACPSTGTCDYAEGRCGCITCDDYDGSPQKDQWMCRAWASIPAAFVDGGELTTSPTCTAERARLGSPCTDTTVVCGYDACNGLSLGPYTECIDGTWAVGPQTDSCNRPGCR